MEKPRSRSRSTSNKTARAQRREIRKFWGHRWTIRCVGNHMAEVTVFPVDGSRTSRGVWELTDLQTHPLCRGQGHASALLRSVCMWADRAGINIRLYIMPYTGLPNGNSGDPRHLRRADPDVAVLARMYRRWGWRSTRQLAFGGGHPTMLRVARAHLLPDKSG